MNEQQIRLLEEIKQQAQQECEAITARAEAQRREEKDRADRQIQTLRDKHEAELKRQMDDIHSASRQATQRITREHERLFSQMLFEQVELRFREILEEHTRTEDYRRSLINWCIAGIKALESEEILIEASPRAAELLDQGALDDITAAVQNIPVVKVTAPQECSGEGVVLYSADRRMLYSSLITDHLQRCSAVIRRLVHDHLAGRKDLNQ